MVCMLVETAAAACKEDCVNTLLMVSAMCGVCHAMWDIVICMGISSNEKIEMIDHEWYDGN